MGCTCGALIIQGRTLSTDGSHRRRLLQAAMLPQATRAGRVAASRW